MLDNYLVIPVKNTQHVCINFKYRMVRSSVQTRWGMIFHNREINLKYQTFSLSPRTITNGGKPKSLIEIDLTKAAHNGAILNAIRHFGNSAIAIATSRHVRNSIAEVQIRQFRLNSTFWVNRQSLGNPKKSGYLMCKILIFWR